MPAKHRKKVQPKKVKIKTIADLYHELGFRYKGVSEYKSPLMQANEFEKVSLYEGTPKLLFSITDKS